MRLKFSFITFNICSQPSPLDYILNSLGLNVKYVEVSLQIVVMQEDMLKPNIWTFLLPVLSVVNYWRMNEVWRCTWSNIIQTLPNSSCRLKKRNKMPKNVISGTKINELWDMVELHRRMLSRCTREVVVQSLYGSAISIWTKIITFCSALKSNFSF